MNSGLMILLVASILVQLCGIRDESVSLKVVIRSFSIGIAQYFDGSTVSTQHRGYLQLPHQQGRYPKRQ